MNDLKVDSELAAIVIDDQDTDASTTSVEGVSETGPEVGLINDREVVLNITSLGHGNNYHQLAMFMQLITQEATYQFHLADQEHGIA